MVIHGDWREEGGGLIACERGEVGGSRGVGVTLADTQEVYQFLPLTDTKPTVSGSEPNESPQSWPLIGPASSEGRTVNITHRHLGVRQRHSSSGWHAPTQGSGCGGWAAGVWQDGAGRKLAADPGSISRAKAERGQICQPRAKAKTGDSLPDAG